VGFKIKMQGTPNGEMLRVTRSPFPAEVSTVSALPFGKMNAGVGTQHFVLLDASTLKNCSSLQSNAAPENGEGFLIIETNTIRGC
jgi:hypothetical protein